MGRGPRSRGPTSRLVKPAILPRNNHTDFPAAQIWAPCPRRSWMVSTPFSPSARVFCPCAREAHLTGEGKRPRSLSPKLEPCDPRRALFITECMGFAARVSALYEWMTWMNGPNDLGWNSGLDGGVSPERAGDGDQGEPWLAGW